LANQIKHGLNNLHVAFLTGDGTGNGEPVYEDPVRIPGAVQFSVSPAGKADNYYGDNGIWFSSNPGGNATGTLQLWDIDPEVKARMLGDYIDADGKYVETDGQGETFALLGQQDGSVSNTRFVYYKCTASRSDYTYDTDNDTVQAKQDACNITSTRQYFPSVDKSALAAHVNSQAAPDDYADFFEAVIAPKAPPALGG
jgi:phi13 family phage major tail protein